ncbi:hypothetical protein ACWDBD_32115 [Streptomyces sp. NPDC001118]
MTLTRARLGNRYSHCIAAASDADDIDPGDFDITYTDCPQLLTTTGLKDSAFANALSKARGSRENPPHHRRQEEAGGKTARTQPLRGIRQCLTRR